MKELKTDTADSWEKFERVVHPLVQMSHGGFPWFVFRGQPEQHEELLPNLVRLDRHLLRDKSLARTVERAAMIEFKRLAHLHLSPRDECPNDWELEWSILMQHYRAPTRLLDWSEFPHVALYFAVCSSPETDGEVWAAPAAEVNKSYGHATHVRDNLAEINAFFDAGQPEIAELAFVRPTRWSDRMSAQGAWVSVSSQPNDDHCGLIQRPLTSVDGPQGEFTRIRIPRESKPSLRKRLMYMNIHARSLFPGIDGLGASVRESAQAYLHDSKLANEQAQLSGPEGGILVGKHK